MKKLYFHFCLGLLGLVLLGSCKSDSENSEQVNPENNESNEVKGEPYSNAEIGWSTIIPEGWDILTKDQLDANMENGKVVIEESSTVQFDYSGLTQLINFQKDPKNQFLSSIEPFEVEYEGEWEENNQLVYGFLFQTFSYQGIPVDTSSTVVSIDGLDFQVLHMTIHAADGSIIMHEDMYGRLINGYDFSIIITYDNELNKKALENVIYASTFTKRD